MEYQILPYPNPTPSSHSSLTYHTFPRGDLEKNPAETTDRIWPKRPRAETTQAETTKAETTQGWNDPGPFPLVKLDATSQLVRLKDSVQKFVNRTKFFITR